MITCSGKIDGGGAQIHAKLSVIALAAKCNVKFLYTPSQVIAHKPNSIKEDEWLQKWEDYFNNKNRYQNSCCFSENFWKISSNYNPEYQNINF
jgi:hypothetical protein